MAEVTIIGAGVSGLSSAIRLAEDGFAVRVITRDLPHTTTSTVAGAIWSGHMEDAPRRRWALHSLKVFQELAQNPASGVLLTRFRDIYPHPIHAPWYRDELDFCQQIPASELPAGYVDGYLMDVPLVETPAYLAYLERWLRELGGSIEQREILSLAALSGEARLIVNCSGAWARYIANDEDVHPLWGQVLLVDAPQVKESIMDDVSFTYIFPRPDGVVLGGVSIADRWERTIDPAVSEEIMARCEKLIPGLRQAKIIAHKVGLRPGRHAVRLEREELGAGRTVIHNYGHGSVGFTLSWGCAADVLDLARQVTAR